MSDELDISTDEVVTQEALEPTMDETIQKTLDEINSRGEESTQETEEEKAARDEKGRFAKKEDEAKEAPPVEPAEATEPPAEVKPDPITLSPEFQRLGLRKDEVDAIAKADPVVMQAFMRRSEEMHRGLEQYREKAQIGETFQRVLEPYSGNLQAAGVSPDVAVQKLFSADHALRNGSPEQKAAMINQIARDYGVDLGLAQNFQQNPVDAQVYSLQSQLQQMQSWIQQQSQAREGQERESLNSEITRFASDPKNEHFEEVRGDMAGLLQAGLAPNLEKAYEMAIYANPTVRAKVLAKQQAEAEAQRRAEAVQKATAAKAAAAVNVSRKGALPSAKAIGTMDDTIRETAEKLGLIS